MRWRTGRKVGRTIYRQVGAEPSDDDELIGVMDTRELAADVVHAYALFRVHGADLEAMKARAQEMAAHEPGFGGTVARYILGEVAP